MSQALAPSTTPAPADFGTTLRVLVGTALLVLLAPGFIARLTPPEGLVFDFFKEWASARNRLEGHPVYDDQRVAVERYTGATIDSTLGYFDTWNTHPPLSAALALPLARLDLQTAHLAWNVASLLALAATVAIAVRELAVPWKVSWLVFGVGALPLCDPVVQTLVQGQPNLFLALLLTGCWAAERRGNPWLAGGLAATAAMLKIYPGWLLLYFLVRRDWRAVAGFGLGTAVVTGTTVALLGWDCHVDYLTRVLPGVSNEINNWGNLSLTAFWDRLFGMTNPGVIETWGPQPVWRNLGLGVSILAVAATALAAAFISAGQGQRSKRTVEALFGLQVLAMLLLTPMTWHHALVILAAPLIVLWQMVPRGTWSRSVLLAALVLLWISPKPVWAYIIRPEPGSRERGVSSSANLPGLRIARPLQSLTALSYQTYALVALFGLSVGLVITRRVSEGESR